MFYLGIDQSLSNTGLSLISTLNNKITVLHTQDIKTDKNLNISKNLRFIEFNLSGALYTIKKTISKYNLDPTTSSLIVGYEGIFNQRNPTVLIKLAKVQGIVELCCVKHNLEHYVITPATWQCYFGLNGVKGKNKSVKYLKERTDVEYIDEEDKNINHHRADATLIALYLATGKK